MISLVWEVFLFRRIDAYWFRKKVQTRILGFKSWNSMDRGFLWWAFVRRSLCHTFWAQVIMKRIYPISVGAFVPLLWNVVFDTWIFFIDKKTNNSLQPFLYLFYYLCRIILLKLWIILYLSLQVLTFIDSYFLFIRRQERLNGLILSFIVS